MDIEFFVIALGLVASPLLAGAVVLGAASMRVQMAAPSRRVLRALDQVLAPRGWRGMRYAHRAPTAWVRHLPYGIVWLEAPGHAALRAALQLPARDALPVGFRGAWAQLLAVSDRAELREGQLLVRLDGLDADAIERVLVAIEGVMAAAFQPHMRRAQPRHRQRPT